MDGFLQIINDLQDVFSTVGVSPEIISLPQIVVVGSQSTGKSSVLESIVQKNFLPRGTGIVTRRPLIMQINQDIEAIQPWGSFLHCPEKKFEDFNLICEEIIRDTERVCGNDKNINSEPITLRIHSADLPTLSLVDLPGITKNAVGDQPRDIEQQTTALVRKYIENPNCIILAVSPGNIDIANSESIKLAKEVDPQGDRTLAVITKVDLMEKSAENSRVLEGKVIPIKLGIVGVINRTQAEINVDMPIEESFAREAEFFKTHFNYMSNEMGTPYLTQRLCSVLMQHVKQCLPELIIRITEQKVIQQNILDSLGPRIEDEPGALADLVMKFCREFRSNMEGRRSVQFAAAHKAMSGGRHLFEVFESAICQELDKIALPEDIEEHIEHEIISAGGSKPALFTPNIVFDNLASRQLEHFTYPIKKSIKKCNETLTEIISLLSKKTFERFPVLKRETHQISLTLLLAKTQVVEKFIDSYIQCELCYINTNHRLFIKNRPQLEKNCSEQSEGSEVLTPEQISTKKIRALLDLYIHIIRNQLMDVVPKTVICYMVLQFCDDLHKDLMKTLFSSDRVDDLMKEDMLVEERREKAVRMLGALERADAITSLLE